MEDKGEGEHTNAAYTSDEHTPPYATDHDFNDMKLTDMSTVPTHDEDDKISVTSNGEIVLRKREFDPKKYNAFARGTMTVQRKVITSYNESKTLIWKCIGIVALLLYLAYFAYAMYYRFGDEGSIRLLACTLFGILLLLLHLLRHQLVPFWSAISNFLLNPEFHKIRKIIRWVLYVVNLIAVVTLLIVLVALETPRNLLSLAGLAGFVILGFLTSHNPAMINWHPVVWGFSLQFYFAVVILKTPWGYAAFRWLGDRITEFLSYSDEGAKFVFGDSASIKPLEKEYNVITFEDVYLLHFFAFKIMPVVTFFGTVIAILYYIGVMQSIIKVVGHFLSFCLGTTPAESLNAAGNIFVAMTEGPLMIRPFIPTMTRSELHAVMTGGFATISGSVLGAYASFGVPANHLLSASVMSAPAALAISKLTYPEDEIPVVDDDEYSKIEKTKESNVIEAAYNGAAMSGKIIASIVVNVIAFLSLLTFFNATLIWFGDRVGIKGFTFEFICSYLLYPVALFMGTEPSDCRTMGELIGIKTFTNEFIAYQRLSGILKNRGRLDSYVKTTQSGDWHWDGDDIILDQLNNTRLLKGIISRRSEVIATYALCGFSNFGSMGILLGSLSAMAPNRRGTMSKLIFRAMMAGNVACFFTACIAGLFFEDYN